MVVQQYIFFFIIWFIILAFLKDNVIVYFLLIPSFYLFTPMINMLETHWPKWNPAIDLTE